MRKHLFFFALLLPLSFAFTTPENDLSETGCPPPSNVTLTNQSGGAATFDWDGCGCIGAYLVYFTKDGQTSPEYVTGASGITIAGLSSGTYQFYFYTICGGESSSIIVEEVII